MKPPGPETKRAIVKREMTDIKLVFCHRKIDDPNIKKQEHFRGNLLARVYSWPPHS